ncbi:MULTISPECIES: YgaP-like transmembrane domain [Allobacillus]|uniref:DUF2892 domain-containing protein n=1 Tax=Allobacillus halotolerans TaxID=570278 RepID=A0ABS6GR65_9BACI|nr:MULTISPECIES: YgaP-like transmembrane domain [Allobacillus]MBU6081401.1 DUF2892 domain-containing protein [Allobacillus halotolerans]
MRKQNIGTVSAFVRTSIGLCGLAVGSARLSRRPLTIGNLLLVELSALIAAEGMTKYCPTKELFDPQRFLHKPYLNE